jgi:hypothetical protein
VIKQLLYILVVLLNLNVLLSPDELRQPYKLIFGCRSSEKNSRGYCTIPDRLLLPLSSVVVLGVINFLGYFFVVFYLAATEIPILIKRTRTLANAHMNDPFFPPTRYLDLNAFRGPIVFGIFGLAFCFMHWANYEPNNELYWLVAGILIFWAAKCFRDFVVVPFNPLLLFLVCLFDIVFRKPFLRNHLMLQTVSILGFRNTEWFSLMLLDIFSVSPLLQDIIRSFTQPMPKLAVTLFVTLATSFIFVSFGYSSFAGRSSDDENGETQWRSPEDDGEEVQCGTVIQCFYYVVYYGLPGGDISGLLSQIDIDDSSLWRRMLYDLAFFLWIGIVMMNIVAGLILDAFGSLREEAKEREDTLSSTCFICGIKEPVYEDISLPPKSPNFEVHKDEEHNLWNYVFYIAYLLEKDTQDCNGIESFVLSEIERDSLHWLPVRTSYVIQEAQKAGVIDADLPGDEEEEDQ